MKRVFKLLSVGVVAFLGMFDQVGAADRNWMRDYVQLRTKASVERAVGAAQATAPQLDSRIVGGAVAPASLHKFQVALLNSSLNTDFQAQYCGGTLIASQYVVTAAHCSDFVGVDEVAVLAGTRVLSTRGMGNRVGVESITIHPGWNPNTFENDVAVWKLVTPVTNVVPARLPLRGSDPVNGASASVTGWGTMSAVRGAYPTKLMAVTVPVVSRSTCNRPSSYYGTILNSMFCAGRVRRDSCYGDSGGPLSLRPDQTALVGIVSWGEGCGRAGYPGVYTRVGDPVIYDFIYQTVNAGPS